MPTGYTAEVADGKVTDFPTFALRCAGAFGATIMQRDNPMDEPPQLREESTFYAESVARDEKRVAESEVMTLAEAEVAAEAAFRAALTYRRERAEEVAATRNRYNTMLVAAMAWQAPSPEHEGLKKLMIEQLTESREFDCTLYGEEPVRESAAAWLACERAAAHRSLSRSIESLAEERARVAQANQWITALYESLRVKVPA